VRDPGERVRRTRLQEAGVAATTAAGRQRRVVRAIARCHTTGGLAERGHRRRLGLTRLMLAGGGGVGREGVGGVGRGEGELRQHRHPAVVSHGRRADRVPMIGPRERTGGPRSEQGTDREERDAAQQHSSAAAQQRSSASAQQRSSAAAQQHSSRQHRKAPCSLVAPLLRERGGCEGLWRMQLDGKQVPAIRPSQVK